PGPEGGGGLGRGDHRPARHPPAALRLGPARARAGARRAPRRTQGPGAASVSAAPDDRAPLRVTLVEDHELYRQGLDEMLRTEGFRVVAQAARGDDGVALALRARPD